MPETLQERWVALKLRECLFAIKQADEEDPPNYAVRYLQVLKAIHLAALYGLKAGFRIDPGEPEWPVAYIELPTGQVSWHMPQHELPWDGHTTEEKYRRIEALTGR